MNLNQIVILGAGDKGTALAIRLFRAGYAPILLERENPTDLYHFRNYSSVVYSGNKYVEGIECVSIFPEIPLRKSLSTIDSCIKNRNIPLLAGDDQAFLDLLNPEIVVDCRSGLIAESIENWENYSHYMRIGNQFRPGVHGNHIIGDRGRAAGRVFHPDIKEYFDDENPIRRTMPVTAPLEGVFIAEKSIGDQVHERESIGSISGIAIMAPETGYLTGVTHSGHFVAFHQPLFMIKSTARFNKSMIHCIPSEYFAIAGGILEAITTIVHQKAE